MMGFIRWFKASLEDDKGQASFRRIYNWIIISLVSFIVTWASWKEVWSMFYIYVLIILLVAGFLNTSVITVDNILRFFNRDKDQSPAPAPAPNPAPVQTHIEGDLQMTPNPNPTSS